MRTRLSQKDIERMREVNRLMQEQVAALEEKAKRAQRRNEKEVFKVIRPSSRLVKLPKLRQQRAERLKEGIPDTTDMYPRFLTRREMQEQSKTLNKVKPMDNLVEQRLYQPPKSCSYVPPPDPQARARHVKPISGEAGLRLTAPKPKEVKRKPKEYSYTVNDAEIKSMADRLSRCPKWWTRFGRTPSPNPSPLLEPHRALSVPPLAEGEKFVPWASRLSDEPMQKAKQHYAQLIKHFANDYKKVPSEYVSRADEAEMEELFARLYYVPEKTE